MGHKKRSKLSRKKRKDKKLKKRKAIQEAINISSKGYNYTAPPTYQEQAHESWWSIFWRFITRQN